ncbi:MAG: hypothetical protein KF861_03980, partial [Planctomycetaceae bacterium]|nr:hypothetical protein [Planctomycetaceae bacterium]
PGDDRTGTVQLADDSGIQALVGTETNWSTLNERGLMGPGSKIKVSRAGGAGQVTLTLLPVGFPLSGSGPHVVHTFEDHPDSPLSGTSNPLTFALQLQPDIMPDESVLELPRGTCIDLQNSILPEGWRIAVDRMDILFSSAGPVVGAAAAKGVIHLHIVEIADALANTPAGSPTVLTDLDGDGKLDPRHGPELGLTIFTKSGRTISHSIAPYPAAWRPNFPYKLGDWAAASGTATFTDGTPAFFLALAVNVGPPAGTSGGSEPGWNRTDLGLNAQFSDSGVTWVAKPHDPWELGLEGEVAR